jgi:hypothetical protein
MIKEVYNTLPEEKDKRHHEELCKMFPRGLEEGKEVGELS